MSDTAALAPTPIVPRHRFEALSMRLVEQLFSNLSDAPFFIKDGDLRYVACNAAMLDLCGVQSESEFLGRSARDFYPEVLRAKYEHLDRQVLRTGKALKDRLDLLARLRGKPVWILYSRWPVEDQGGAIVGVAAVARVLDRSERRHPVYERLARAVEFIQNNFRSEVDAQQLARLCGVSVSQLERDFVNLFGLSPRRYANKLRFEAAAALLTTTDQRIVTIAHACGYSDQSAFTRRFRDASGMSPTEYRHSQFGNSKSS